MKRIAFILSVLSFQLTGFSQLGVGTNSPDASAQLDVAATDKGFLAPRIALTSATDVTTIATPATGLMIYNTATAGTSPNNVIPGYYYYDGTKWVRFINAQPSATISFSTADPNSGSPTFTPNTPQNNGYIYVSAINSSLWVWNGSTYISYEAPSTTPFYLTGSTTDAGGNKTSDVYRTGSIGVGTSSPSKLLDVVNTSSSYAGLIEAEGFVSNIYSRGMAIRMRRGTSASPTAIQLNDISAYGFAGYDGTSFSTTSAGIAGIATQNWTSTAKGMGLIFSTTSNSTTTLTERMRIDHNGNVGIRTSTPATTLHMNSNLAATNTINVDGQMLRMMRPQAPYVKWENIAQFNLGSYGVATSPNTHAFTRLDLALNDGEGVATNNVMTWQANGRVGIGTTAPTTNLDVVGGMNLRNAVGAAGSNYGIEFNTNSNSPRIDWVFNGGYIGQFSTDANDFILRNSKLSTGNIRFFTNPSGSQAERLTILNNGNVGVGTSSPTSRLEVNGSATNNVAYNAGSGTSIDFSLSNLAYTTASAGTFTITNIKNGGTYSLAVQGATSGTSTFSCSGFTFIYVNNGITAPNKHTMYTFIVMGTTVYVYMATGF